LEERQEKALSNMEKVRKNPTFIGIAVAVVLLAIISALAIPRIITYKANRRLGAEARRLENFLKDAKDYARTQRVEVDIYCVDAYRVSRMTIPSPTLSYAINVWNEQWIPTACAENFVPMTSMPEASSRALKAKNITTNYERLLEAKKDIRMTASYGIDRIIRLLPDSIRASDNSLPFIEYRMISERTRRAYSIFINAAGATLVCQSYDSSPDDEDRMKISR
jgi:Tfp pilus assembly protein FimT